MPTDRPYVVCHMCTTLDGKTLSARWGKLPGNKDGTSLFESTAATYRIPAWLVGTTTMKEFAGKDQPLPPAPRGFDHGDHVARPKAKGYAIGADAKGVLRFQEGESDGDHVVLLVTERVSGAYLAHLRAAGVSYLVCGQKTLDLPLALRKLRDAFGLKKLMLQGGGTFNGAMLAAGLVDEVSHVVLPIIDGGKTVTGFFDVPGDTPSKAQATLKLAKTETLPGGAVWSRYKVVGRPA